MLRRVLFLALAVAQFLGCAAQEAPPVAQSTSSPANASAPQPAPANGLDWASTSSSCWAITFMDPIIQRISRGNSSCRINRCWMLE